jgi:Flp pilus assembly pilin Flp
MMKIQSCGQSVTEYGIVMALVAVVGFVGVRALGQNLNGMFSAMLPAPQAKSSPMSQSVPEGDVLSVTTDMQTDSSNNSDSNLGDKTGKRHNQRDYKPRTPSQSDLLLEKYRKVTQTVGSLGDEQKVFADANRLIKQAEKYKKTDPNLFNQIISLGIQGKKMAKKMTVYEKDATAENGNVLLDKMMAYRDSWMKMISSPTVNKRLNKEDRVKVDTFAGTSFNLGGAVYSGNGNVVNADKAVDSNSNKIIDCGKQYKCKK